MPWRPPICPPRPTDGRGRCPGASGPPQSGGPAHQPGQLAPGAVRPSRRGGAAAVRRRGRRSAATPSRLGAARVLDCTKKMLLFNPGRYTGMNKTVFLFSPRRGLVGRPALCPRSWLKRRASWGPQGGQCPPNKQRGPRWGAPAPVRRGPFGPWCGGAWAAGAGRRHTRRLDRLTHRARWVKNPGRPPLTIWGCPGIVKVQSQWRLLHTVNTPTRGFHSRKACYRPGPPPWAVLFSPWSGHASQATGAAACTYGGCGYRGPRPGYPGTPNGQVWRGRCREPARNLSRQPAGRGNVNREQSAVYK